jgi:hypothetical protein
MRPLAPLQAEKNVFIVVDFCSDCRCFASLMLQEEPGEGKKDAAKATGKGKTWREPKH